MNPVMRTMAEGAARHFGAALRWQALPGVMGELQKQRDGSLVMFIDPHLSDADVFTTLCHECWHAMVDGDWLDGKAQRYDPARASTMAKVAHAIVEANARIGEMELDQWCRQRIAKPELRNDPTAKALALRFYPVKRGGNAR